MKRLFTKHAAFTCAIALILLFGFFFVYLCILKNESYRRPYRTRRGLVPLSLASPMPAVVYPEAVRALYITASTADSPRMEDVVRLIKRAEVEPYAPNAVVIDLQDASGRVVMDDRMRMLVRQLRFLHIFPIARLVVFQNNSVAKEHPAWAIH